MGEEKVQKEVVENPGGTTSLTVITTGVVENKKRLIVELLSN